MAKNQYVAIIQARLGSSRLALKSLVTLRGYPLINWVTSRLAKAQRLSSLIVAVPDTRLDSILFHHLTDCGIPCMQGPENDVLDRFLLAANKTDASHIIRVCADNPLIWGEAVDRLIAHYEAKGSDYAYNHIPRNNRWPDGLGAEIFSREILTYMAEHAKQPSEREHCCNYIWNNPRDFRITTFDPEEEWLCRPDIKLDIDTKEDYMRLAELPITPETPMRQIIDICDKIN